jgi:hypothetical protein
MFEFAERQILDVHGSVLDARNQLLLLSARADVSVEYADFEPAAPLRLLALALESNSTAPSSTTRSDSSGAADDAARIDERRNAKARCVAFRRPRAARQLAGRSRRARAAISEMFHGRDQLPLGPHANRILVHRLVDNGERHKRGQFKALHADADLGGALSDEADVRRGGDDFVDTTRALFGTVDGALKRQPGGRRKWVSEKLKRRGKVRNEIKRTQVSHIEEPELRQLAQLGRQPF